MSEAPVEVFQRRHTPPREALPLNAVDCHMHVFGPFERYPLAPERAYNVAAAPLAAHEAMKRAVGLERTVLVQPSGYGDDNRAMLAALRALGDRGRAVAVVTPDTPRTQLERMHEAGVRGVRLNFHTLAERYRGDPTEWIERFSSILTPLGWHLQIFASAESLAELAPALARCAVDVVIDHMGMPDAAQGTGQRGFQALLDLLSSGRVWVKLSGADRIAHRTGNLCDAIPFMQALVERAPDRLVWGSDWPNIGFHAGRQVCDGAILPYRDVDAGALLDLLAEAVPDRDARRKILVLNPQKLYGF